MQAVAADLADITSEKAAFQFLGRCVTTWAQPAVPNGNAQGQPQGLPGFERFVYERLVPSAFGVLSSPQFNIKDGQASLVRSASHVIISRILTSNITLGCTRDRQLPSACDQGTRARGVRLLRDGVLARARLDATSRSRVCHETARPRRQSLPKVSWRLPAF